MCLVTTALMCSVTTAKNLATLPKTALTKCLHQEYLITGTGGVPGCIMTTTIETDHSPLTTDTATEDALTSYDHTTDPTTTEALATIKDMHPTPHPPIAAVCTILWPTGALSNTHARTHHTGITTTHLDNATFPTGITLEGIPQTEANLVQAIFSILFKDHTQRKWQNFTQEQQPLINATARRRSSFKIHRLLPGIRQLQFFKLLKFSTGGEKTWINRECNHQPTIIL